MTAMQTPQNQLLSFERLRRLFAFYAPLMRPKLALAAGFTALCYVLTLVTITYAGAGLSSVWSGLPVFAYYAGPLVFALVADYNLELTLPASWLEKALVAIIYTFVISPLVLALAWFGPMAIAYAFTDEATLVDRTMQFLESSGVSGMSALYARAIYLNAAISMVIAAVILLAITCARRDRLTWGAVAGVICYGVISLGSVALGATIGFMTADAATDMDSPEAGNVIVSAITDRMPAATIGLTAVFLICIGLILWKYKTRKG